MREPAPQVLEGRFGPCRIPGHRPGEAELEEHSIGRWEVGGGRKEGRERVDRRRCPAACRQAEPGEESPVCFRRGAHPAVVGGSQADNPLGVGKALERRPGSLPGITPGEERRHQRRRIWMLLDNLRPAGDSPVEGPKRLMAPAFCQETGSHPRPLWRDLPGFHIRRNRSHRIPGIFPGLPETKPGALRDRRGRGARHELLADRHGAGGIPDFTSGPDGEQLPFGVAWPGGMLTTEPVEKHHRLLGTRKLDQRRGIEEEPKGTLVSFEALPAAA